MATDIALGVSHSIRTVLGDCAVANTPLIAGWITSDTVGVLGRLSPMPFVADTVNVYVAPTVRPFTTLLVSPAAASTAPVAADAVVLEYVIVYALIGELFDAEVDHVTVTVLTTVSDSVALSC